MNLTFFIKFLNILLPVQLLRADINDAFSDFGGSGFIGSVSHLISAALQTAGMYAQSEILKSFGSALINLAALCFLCSIIGALFSTAIFGTYRKAVYLLLGPVFFKFIIDTREPVNGTQFRMGKRVDGSIEDQKEMLKKYGFEGINDEAKVSFFYLAFDNLVSSVVQDVTNVLIDTSKKEDIVIKARERVFSWALATYPSSPGFIQLVLLGYSGNCANIIGKVDAIRNNKIDATRRLNINSPESRDNLNDLGKSLLTEYLAEKDRKLVKLIKYPEVANYLNIPADSASLSCQEIWDHIRETTLALANDTLDINKFFGDGARDPNINWAEVLAEVKKSLSSTDALGAKQNPEDILAAYIIRAVLRKTPQDSLMTNTFDRIPFAGNRHDTMFKEIAGYQSYGAYSRIQYFAASIPYIQGMLLFMLSAAFPFFAVFLVMPGRAMTFLVWGALWVWVKSWDLGFAMLIVVRKILWQFVAHETNGFSATIDLKRPESVFEIIAQGDPLASFNTYTQIVALLTCSVPLLTAHFCLGATSMFEAFKMSIDETANRFGQQRAIGMLRLGASAAENKQWNYLEAAGMRAFSDTLRKGGKTDDGQDLKERMDNSIFNRGLVAYQHAKMEAHWSEQGIENAARLSALTGRETTNSYTRRNLGGNALLGTYRSYLEQTYVGQPAGTGGAGIFGSQNISGFSKRPPLDQPPSRDEGE